MRSRTSSSGTVLRHLPFVCTFNTGAGQRMYSEVGMLVAFSIETCGAALPRAPSTLARASTTAHFWLACPVAEACLQQVQASTPTQCGLC